MAEKRSLASLFDAAIAIDSEEELVEFIETQCRGDRELQSQLEGLLIADAKAKNFLEDRSDLLQRVLDNLQQTVDVPNVMLQDPDPKALEPLQDPSSPEIPARDMDGRYQLQGEIARGGMGAIIKGRDTDLGRELAIKVLLEEHKEKPEAIQRLIEEAQIGGQLQHPGITPVYELGQFEDRRPFFSMKLVKGRTLSKLLSERQSPSKERAKFLGIFEQVCPTLGYAHARGVIHRDLKPANIMVGPFGEVQVMDWGLAKVLPEGGIDDEKAAQTDRDVDITVLRTRRSGSSENPISHESESAGSTGSSETEMGSVMGTPAYMAPEQALGEIDQLNQRTDVFGLGAILCEILTGKPPYTGDNTKAVFRLASRGDLEEANVRLDACDADEELISLTKHCLAPRASQRPADARALAESITSYLVSIETRFRNAEVERVRESAKVVEQQKRIRITKILTASILLISSLGIAGTCYQWRQAELSRAEAVKSAGEEKDARGEAERSRNAAQEGIKLIASIFDGLDPEEVSNKDRSLRSLIVDQLDEAIERLDGEAIGDPLQVAALQVSLGKSLIALGEKNRAQRLLQKSVDVRRNYLGESHPDTLTSMHNLSLVCAPTELLPLRQKTYDLRRKLLGENDPDTLESQKLLAAAYFTEGNYGKATQLAEDAVTGLRKALGPTHSSTLSAVSELCRAFEHDGQWNKLLALSEGTFSYCLSELGPEDSRTLEFQFWEAWSRYRLEGPKIGVKQLEGCLESATAIIGEEHSLVLELQTLLIELYCDTQQWHKAIPLGEKTVASCKKKFGLEYAPTLVALGFLSTAYQSTRNTAKALPLAKEVYDLTHLLHGIEHPQTNVALAAYGSQLAEAGMWDEALPIREEVLDFSVKHFGDDHPLTLTHYYELGNTCFELQMHDLSVSLTQEGIKLASHRFGIGHTRTADLICLLAMNLHAQGRAVQAIELLDNSIQVCRRGGAAPIPYLEGLARLHERSRKFVDAAEIYSDLFKSTVSHSLRHTYGRKLIEVLGDMGQIENALFVAKTLIEETRGLFPPLSPLSATAHLQTTNSLLKAVKKASILHESKISEAELIELRKCFVDGSFEQSVFLLGIGSVLNQVGSFEQAEPIVRECLKIREQTLEPESYFLSTARFALGNALLGQKRLAEAKHLLGKGYAGLTDDKIAEICLGNMSFIDQKREWLESELTIRINLYRSFGQDTQAEKLRREQQRRKLAWGRDT